MIGVFVKADDIPLILSTPAHLELYDMLRFRLQVLYGQPTNGQTSTTSDVTLAGMEGLFLTALVEVQSGRGGSHLQATSERLGQQSDSKSSAARSNPLIPNQMQTIQQRRWSFAPYKHSIETASQNLKSSKKSSITLPCKTCTSLQVSLLMFTRRNADVAREGLLSFIVGQKLFALTKSKRTTLGFMRDAYLSYHKADAIGLSEMIASRFPDVTFDHPTAFRTPSRILNLSPKAQSDGRRSSLATRSSDSDDRRTLHPDNRSFAEEDQLDSLT